MRRILPNITKSVDPTFIQDGAVDQHVLALEPKGSQRSQALQTGFSAWKQEACSAPVSKRTNTTLRE